MKVRKVLVPIFTFIITTLILGGLTYLYIKVNAEENKVLTKERLSGYIYSIKDKSASILSEDLVLLRYLEKNNADLTDFDANATNVIEKIEERASFKVHSVSIGKVEDDNCLIINSIASDDNQNLIGFDLFDNSYKQNKHVKSEYTRDTIIITNPFTIGGEDKYFDVRIPVYLKNASDEFYFWGVINTRVKFADIVSSQEYLNSEIGQLLIQLYYEEDGEIITLAGTDDVYKKNCSIVNVDFFNLDWKVAVAPVLFWNSLSFMIVVTIVDVLLVTFATILSVYVVKIKDMNVRLSEMALKDSLTGCYTRRYLNTKIINPETYEWLDQKSCYSLALVDIDSLKFINDKYGHDVGDEVIFSITKCFINGINSRNNDAVVRFGGDEFVVLYNNYSKQQLNWILTNIVSEIRNLKIGNYKDLHITVSIGCAYNEPNKRLKYNALFKKADDISYKVKDAGKNDYRIE